MSQRQFFILVVLILFSFGEILGQSKNVEKIPPPHQNGGDSLADCSLYSYNINHNKTVPFFLKQKTAKPITDIFLKFPSFPVMKPVSMNFYSNNLSFFCRQELLFEKATTIPLKFRLGSVQYTDYLEKKPNAILLR